MLASVFVCTRITRLLPNEGNTLQVSSLQFWRIICVQLKSKSKLINRPGFLVTTMTCRYCSVISSFCLDSVHVPERSCSTRWSTNIQDYSDAQLHAIWRCQKWNRRRKHHWGSKLIFIDPLITFCIQSTKQCLTLQSQSCFGTVHSSSYNFMPTNHLVSSFCSIFLHITPFQIINSENSVTFFEDWKLWNDHFFMYAFTLQLLQWHWKGVWVFALKKRGKHFITN